MNIDHKCYEAGINDSKIITETTFGQGDSTHICYIRCSICGKKSKEFSNWGLFEDSTLRKAQEGWNSNLILNKEK